MLTNHGYQALACLIDHVRRASGQGVFSHWYENRWSLLAQELSRSALDRDVDAFVGEYASTLIADVRELMASGLASAAEGLIEAAEELARQTRYFAEASRLPDSSVDQPLLPGLACSATELNMALAA